MRISIGPPLSDLPAEPNLREIEFLDDVYSLGKQRASLWRRSERSRGGRRLRFELSALLNRWLPATWLGNIQGFPVFK
jgi:hypothetical protein